MAKKKKTAKKRSARKVSASRIKSKKKVSQQSQKDLLRISVSVGLLYFIIFTLLKYGLEKTMDWNQAIFGAVLMIIIFYLVGYWLKK